MGDREQAADEGLEEGDTLVSGQQASDIGERVRAAQAAVIAILASQ